VALSVGKDASKQEAATLTLAESQLALAALGSLRAGDREAVVVLQRLLPRVHPTLTRRTGPVEPAVAERVVVDVADGSLDVFACVRIFKLDPMGLNAHGRHSAHEVDAVAERHAVADVKVCHVPQCPQLLHMDSS